jgi:hypothetical protein
MLISLLNIWGYILFSQCYFYRVSSVTLCKHLKILNFEGWNVYQEATDLSKTLV